MMKKTVRWFVLHALARRYRFLLQEGATAKESRRGSLKLEGKRDNHVVAVLSHFFPKGIETVVVVAPAK